MGSIEKATEPTSTPPATPPLMGYGQLDHSFTLQAIMELQSSFAEVKAEIRGMKASIDSTKSKVEELANWKHKIIGGAIALGAVSALLGMVATKAGDYITFKAPAQAVIPAK